MALGTLLGAIAAPLVGGLASSILGGGSKKSIDNLSKTPGVGFNAGGLSATIGKSGVNVASSASRDALVGRIAKTYPELAAQLASLRASVAPGVSGLRTARMLAIENARRASVGDLKENLSRRRVLGSSFAQDALTRSNLAFAQEADKVAAETFMQELDLTHQLLTEESAARRAEFQVLVDELNLQSDAAIKIATGATAEQGANSRMQAQIAMKSLEGVGAAFEPVGAAVGNAVTNLLTPK